MARVDHISSDGFTFLSELDDRIDDLDDPNEMKRLTVLATLEATGDMPSAPNSQRLTLEAGIE